MWEIITSFAAGTDLTAILNLISVTALGKSATEWLISNCKEKDTPQEVFLSILIGTACDTLSTRFKNIGLLKKLQFDKNKKKLAAGYEESEVFDYFSKPIHLRNENLEEFYQNLFASWEQIIRIQELVNCSEEDLRIIFNDIAKDAVQLWNTNLQNACEKNDRLNIFVTRQNEERFSLDHSIISMQIGEILKILENYQERQENTHIDGTAYESADVHLLKQGVEEKYWEQELRISENDYISARPLSEDNGWWGKLYDILSNAPMLLVGPGGMGKTAFLAYLYQSIKHKNQNCPFQDVFLFSLDTLYSTCDMLGDPGASPLTSAENSPLLQYITRRTKEEYAQHILAAVKQQVSTEDRRPLLLILDGLSEMQLRKQRKPELYYQIINEITAISKKEEYPNIRLIVSSRAETKEEREIQAGSLPEWFQTIRLCGIHEAIVQELPLKPQIQKLLDRPMYYKHIKKCLEEGQAPTTQYHLLKEMYSAISKQMVENLPKGERPHYYEYILKFLLPNLAYHEWMWIDHKITLEVAKECCEEMVTDWPRLISYHINKGTQTKRKYDDIINDIRYYLKDTEKIMDYLVEQNQIILLENGDYVFRHQDYRDFLVAEYFIQRIEFLRENLNSRCWENEKVIRSMRLNTYGKDIMKLIYQAVDFENSFVPYFDIHSARQLESSDISSGCVLWYTTPYQLSDMSRVIGITYDKERLGKDTLYILNKLTEYACRESTRHQRPGRPVPARPLLAIHGQLKQNLIEILVKTCELILGERDYDTALKITQAANYICRRTENGVDTDPMASAIDYYIVKIYLAEFAFNGEAENLPEAFSLLYRCAIGNENLPPYRYACITMGMMLASPHPKLKGQHTFQQFMDQISNDFEESRFVTAFWMYYNALFDQRKKGEAWVIRLYPLKQMLFLLAENKVQFSPDVYNPEQIDSLNVETLSELCDNPIVCDELCGAVPEKNNLRLINRFLKEIENINEPWTCYLKGLVCFILNEDTEQARQCFQRAVQNSLSKDTIYIRAQMWLALIDGDQKSLDDWHRAGKTQAEKMSEPSSVTSFSIHTYYERDVTELYNELRGIIASVHRGKCFIAIFSDTPGGGGRNHGDIV